MTAPRDLPDQVNARLELFPAYGTIITSDDRSTSFEKSLVIVSEDEIYVYGQAYSEPIYRNRIDSAEGKNTRGYNIVSSNGDKIYVKRGEGCGCTDPMKAWRPFRITSGMLLDYASLG